MKTAVANRRTSGFSLPELMVVMVLVSVLGAVAYSAIRSAMVLFAQNVSMNVSGAKARHAMDRLGDLICYSKGGAQLINSSGELSTNSEAPGILGRRVVGGPYRLRAADGANGDIAAAATSFQLHFTSNPDLAPPTPETGHVLFVVGLEDVYPELEISSVAPVAGGTDYQAVSVTTRTSLGVTAKGEFRINAYLIRKEAYVHTGNPNNGDLRRYPFVRTGMDWNSSTNYEVVLSKFTIPSVNLFKREVDGQRPSFSIRMNVQSGEYQRYLSSRHKKDTYTAMPVKATFRPAEN